MHINFCFFQSFLKVVKRCKDQFRDGAVILNISDYMYYYVLYFVRTFEQCHKSIPKYDTYIYFDLEIHTSIINFHILE